MRLALSPGLSQTDVISGGFCRSGPRHRQAANLPRQPFGARQAAFTRRVSASLVDGKHGRSGTPLTDRYRTRKIRGKKTQGRETLADDVVESVHNSRPPFGLTTETTQAARWCIDTMGLIAERSGRRVATRFVCVR